jgi:hypothetical protein
MTPACKTKVEEFLRVARKDPKLTLSATEEKQIDKAINQSARDIRARDPNKWRAMTAEERTTAAGIEAAGYLERKADANALSKIWSEKQRVSNQRDMFDLAKLDQNEGGTATTGIFKTKENDMPYSAALIKIMEQTYRQKQGAMAQLHGELADLWGKLSGKFSRMPYMDAPEAQGFMNLVYREMRGESTNSAEAKTMAMQLSEMMEGYRQRLNGFGANIAKMKDFVPQSHSALLVRKAGRENWVNKTYDLIDRNDFIDETGANMDEAGIKSTLSDMWETIVSKGESKKVHNEKLAQLEGPLGDRSIMDRASAFSRKINFKDAASHEAYHAQFSEQEPVGLLLEHLNNVAGDLAIIERHGPDAKANIEKLREVANYKDVEHALDMTGRGKKANTEETGKRTVAGVNTYQMMEALLGRENDFKSGLVDAVRWFTSMHSATKLTRTALRAVPQDMNTLVSYSGELGVRGQIPQMVKAATNGATKKQLRSMGLASAMIEQSLQNISRRTNVQTGKLKGIGILGQSGMNRAAYTTAHLTGLQAWTNTAGAIGQLIHGAHFAEMAGKEWGQLKNGTKQLFSMSGITENNWNSIRRVPLSDVGGVKIPDVGALKSLNLPAGEHNEIARTVQGFLNDGHNMITNEKDLLSRTAAMVGAQPGTGAHAVMQSLMLFKGVVSVITANMIKRWKRQDTLGMRLAVTAPYMVGATLGGYVGNQLVNLSDGKDLQDANDWRTWGAAFSTGGGAGFAGDMIAGGLGQINDTQGGGNGWRLLGPTGSEVGDILDLTGAVHKAIGGDSTARGKAEYKALRFARNHIPVMNLWYAKTAIDRLLMDDVNEDAMPGYKQKMNDLTGKYGGSYWLPPTGGADAPGMSTAHDQNALPIF